MVEDEPPVNDGGKMPLQASHRFLPAYGHLYEAGLEQLATGLDATYQRSLRSSNS